MFIESIEKVNKYKFRITTDKSVFYTYQSDIRRYDIKENIEFPEERYEAFVKETLMPRARKKALDILSRADCSESDLKRKLFLKDYPSNVVDDAINYVKKFNYINDERYAENYLNYRGKSKSSRQLKMELKSKGIDSSIIESLMNDERSDEEALYNLLRKKIKNPEEMDDEKIRKIYAYLYRRGFSAELISSGLRDYLSRT
jgi:recX family